MSKTFKKVVSVTTSVTTILWLSGVAALAPMAAFAATINEGDTIKTATSPDVYIAKYVGAKKFKRLILNPSVFNSYKHLSWSAIKTVTQAEMDAFTTSDLVRALGDAPVYKLVPNGDEGTKQWVNMTAEAFTAAGYDWDSIYVINNTDRDNYTTGAAITGGTSVSPSTTVTPGVAGTLTVSLASDTPAAGIAPLKAARVPFTKFALTAGATDVTITAITAQRTGLAADTALSSVALIDNATNLQVGLNQTLNSVHQVTIRETITIPANTTKYYTLAANMPSSSASASGQVASLALTAIETTSTVSGSLPITGNGQTINETLAIGTYSGAAGSLNVSTSTKEVGVTNFSFSGVKLTAGSAEDVTVYSIRFNQSGSAAASDLSNVIVTDGTTNYATTISSDGKYYTASFGAAGLLIAKGLNKEFTVKGNIVSGSARTIKFDIYRSTDIVVKGNVYGYYLTIDANTSNPFNTTTNPVFMGSTITVSAGTLRVDKSATGAPAANITIGATNQILGAFDFVAAGESVNVASMVFTITTTTVTNNGKLTNITLSKADGTILAGPVDPTYSSSGVNLATFTGTVTFPVGTTQVIVKGNLDNNWTANDTIIVSLSTPATKVTSITGVTTGNTITATPSSAVSANTMTVKAGSLVVSVSGTPVAQTVIMGVTGYTFANYIFDASASGEDVKVTTIDLQDINVTSAESELSSMQLWDGSTALNTGSNVPNLTDAAGTNTQTFTLDSGLIIPKGTSKTIALKGNISGSATAGGKFQWGLASGAAVTATGMSTTLNVAETVNAADGSIMTIAASGQYSVALDSSTPTGKLIAANTTGNTMTVLKFYATSEQINVTKVRLSLNNASSSGNDLSQVYIYDGSTLLGQGVLGIGNATGKTNNASSTFTLTTPLQIPANTDKIVTIKADIAPIYTANTVATAGHMIAIDFYGSTSSSENVGNGASSGVEVLNYSVTTAQTPAYIFKSVPTVAAVALPTSSLTNGTKVISKFSVTADAKGDIDLYKFTFKISTDSPTTGGPLAMQNLTLVDVTSSAEATLYASTTPHYADLVSTVDFRLLAAPGTQDLATTTRTVSAGTTRTFELRATISGSGSGASISTQLEGDAADPAAMNSGLVSANTVEADTNNDFIWSDRSDADHTATNFTTSTDYFNGYLVSGLASSNLTAQVISQ
ncbi:MAG TPA: hypothetical protein P5089_00950 [Candidatus Portnoybacteria bacterium]|nr:hypothetical protein [Candidatus Portnoybacteria bacterium]